MCIRDSYYWVLQSFDWFVPSPHIPIVRVLQKLHKYEKLMLTVRPTGDDARVILFPTHIYSYYTKCRMGLKQITYYNYKIFF